ncbi:MAG: methylmalonyl Co-A mutase-associated GTPase MeaB [Bdellovibrionaceae bacterium]|nr:methylmalonyl Co-A mutase-associated GTPase MeaB [Pseudobdellovibrionaceae bacterium]|tara:strand:+ start:3276 stop:4229 length:954 start_codon:yes stop_codon:yes gene_type:complete
MNKSLFDVKMWVKDMQQGKRIALARIITKIENRDVEVPELMKEIFPLTGKAEVLGVTGPPGAGKSTLVDQLIYASRAEGKKVAVIAVDPSSPFSGGAILGDRIRMQRHYGDTGVYIRSLGTRGKHGGLSHSTKEAVMALDAAGFDRIIVETAGVGQTELAILKLAQTVLVVLVPESGDSIQVMKAGLMEIADLFVVNKSDRPAADQLVRELVVMVGMNSDHEAKWSVPVLKTEAVKSVGIDAVMKSLSEHQSYLDESHLRNQKRTSFLSEEIEDILLEKFTQKIKESLSSKKGKEILSDLTSGKITPYDASGLIFKI